MIHPTPPRAAAIAAVIALGSCHSVATDGAWWSDRHCRIQIEQTTWDGEQRAELIFLPRGDRWRLFKARVRNAWSEVVGHASTRHHEAEWQERRRYDASGRVVEIRKLGPGKGHEMLDIAYRDDGRPSAQELDGRYDDELLGASTYHTRCELGYADATDRVTRVDIHERSRDQPATHFSVGILHVAGDAAAVAPASPHKFVYARRYDPQGRWIATEHVRGWGADILVERYDLDEAGRLRTISREQQGWSARFERDGDGRLVRRSTTSGQTTTVVGEYRYDPRGRPLVAIDRDWRMRTTDDGPHDGLVENRTTFRYDGCEELTDAADQLVDQHLTPDSVDRWSCALSSVIPAAGR